MKVFLAHERELKLGPAPKNLLNTAISQLDTIVQRGEYSPRDRERILRLSQLILLMVK